MSTATVPRRAALRRVLGVVSAMLLLLSIPLTAGTASAITANIHLTANVYLRPGPNTQGSPLALMPKGTSPDYICWTRGQSINGLNVWFNVTYSGKTGYYASYYDDSHYGSADDIYRLYGIPPCGSGGSGAQQAAVSWAQGQLGSTAWSGRCLAFVRTAWAAGGIDLRSEVNFTWGDDTYPLDVWGHTTAGQTGTGEPTVPGSLVFFYGTGSQGSGTYRTNSHVMIYIGGGQLISTDDYVGSRVHTETFGQHARELGWWLPA